MELLKKPFVEIKTRKQYKQLASVRRNRHVKHSDQSFDDGDDRSLTSADLPFRPR